MPVKSTGSAMLALMLMVGTAALHCGVAHAGMIGAARDAAKGALTYQAKTGPVIVKVTHAFLVKGPDMFGGGTIRRLVLSTVDVAEQIRRCETMMCSAGGITEGMTIDFDAGPRLLYWFVANGQKVQYSGTADPAVVKLTANAPDRLAGTIAFDARTAGGPTVQVEFDAALVKEIKRR